MPYPTEGRIASSQLNDTVAPENSFSTSTNIVFDRIGAWMTRLGLTQFATALGGPIISLGKFARNASTDRQLLAQVANVIKRWNGSNWADVRTMTSTTNKARYSQFLNLVYTVNGNAAVTGSDPIQTYDGTSYGTSQVGSLPKGDFVQAGYEGRVWVLDAATDRVYYSNIVDLSGNITGGTDYIEKLSPQDGESFTGVHRVPRALLIFKQNHIFRVYSATNVDPYPAYNVGTFSNESIVEAKNGLYFHHSSGFYQFNYEGQPTEISRRIKDFVKAIPRSYFESVTGAYDGLDNVTWSIGPVVVEGVAYTNCQVRYTISTQVWTHYDLAEGNSPTAMLNYDSGNIIAQIVGTSQGGVLQQELGNDDNGTPIYFDAISRWMSISNTNMWGSIKQLTSFLVNSTNGSGTKLMYQTDLDGPDVWQELGTLIEKYTSDFPNSSTSDFNRFRYRITGRTKGPQIIFDGVEVRNIIDKGYNAN